MMSGHDPNPIFFNKKKIGRPEHSLTSPPTPQRPITSHFCLNPHPHPSKWTSYVYKPLNLNTGLPHLSDTDFSMIYLIH